MPTYVFFSDPADGGIVCSAATYGPAEEGTGTKVVDSTGGTFNVGQRITGGIYDVWEGFVFFDTSAIPDTSIIFEAHLDLWTEADNSTSNFEVRAYPRDWGTTLADADFVSDTILNGLTHHALLASSTDVFPGSYNTFDSFSTFVDQINKTGNTSFVLASSKQGLTPFDDEYVTFRSADAAGTTSDPKLTVSASADLSATIGTQNTKTPAATTTVITTTAATAAGESILVAFGMDPAAGTVSAVDSASNTYTIQEEVTNGSGTAGCRVVVLAKHDAAALSSGGTITITHPSCAVRVASAAAFALDGPGAKVTSTTLTGNDTVAVLSIAAAVMTPLIIAVIVVEGPSGDTPAQPFGFSLLPRIGTTGGAAASNLTLNWAWRGAVDEVDHTFDQTFAGSVRLFAAVLIVLDSTTALIRTGREKAGMRESDDPADDVVDVGISYNPATGFATELICANNVAGLSVWYAAVVGGTTYGGAMGHGDTTAALPASTVGVTVDAAGNFDITGMDELDCRIPE